MIFPTDDDWNKWDISEVQHRFFVLRWQELFAETTFDSWQVRSFNIKSIFSEMLQAARVTDVSFQHHTNLRALFDVACAILQKDRVIKMHFPEIRYYLAQLGQQYKQDIQSCNPPRVSGFIRLAQMAAESLEEYQSRVLGELETILSKPPQKYKQDLYDLTLLLATEAQNMGFSHFFLQELTHLLTDP